RNFITGYRTPNANNQIGLAWTQGPTSGNYDVYAVPFNTVASMGSSVTTTMTSPSDGSTVSGSVTVAATASTTTGGIAGVQFTLDGANLGAEDTVSPYSTTWNAATATAGTHFLSAIARDSSGATASANTVTVSNDLTAPTVSMTAPAAGPVSGAGVVVAAIASDDIGVAGVQFLLDGSPLGAEVTAVPYAINWDSTTASARTHTLAARARDAAGRQTLSASVIVSKTAARVTPTITWAPPAA